MTSIWAGEYLGTRYQIPDFTWISFSLTDAAFHEGGPHSAIAQAALVDTDARLGEVVAAIERRGVTEQTAIVVVADHGMEQTALNCPGDWGDALRAAGIPHRDEASGFLYLGDM
jgi:predicted AlkP superfamily pyrophosphatase or phosphodiesterase